MKRKPLTPQEKAAMKALYLDDRLSNIEIARKFNVKPNTVPGVARAEGWPMREDRRLRSKHKRSFAKVFLGRDDPKVPPTKLDEAKNALRRRGCIVFDATVTEGSAGEGLIRCDRRVVTPEQLLEMAGLMP
jgi:hypothetical protein